MQLTIDETARRRTKQMRYNEENGITPTQIEKALKQSNLRQLTGDGKGDGENAKTAYISPMEQGAFAADPIIQHMTRPQLEKSIAETTRLMKEAAKRLDFLQAAQYRDEIIRLQKELELK
jgi:excinuclease ABC subunit B